MTKYCLFEGTAPTGGRLDRFLRKFQGSPNDSLASAICEGNLTRFAEELRASRASIDDPVLIKKNVNQEHQFWRTPLELAVDRGAPAKMVVALLEAGATITPVTLKLAVNGALVDWVNLPRTASEFRNAEDIIEVLSAAGADWTQAYFEPKAAHGKREGRTPQHVIQKVGPVRAAQMGLTAHRPPPRPGDALTSPENFIEKKKAEARQIQLDEEFPRPSSPTSSPGRF